MAWCAEDIFKSANTYVIVRGPRSVCTWSPPRCGRSRRHRTGPGQRIQTHQRSASWKQDTWNRNKTHWEQIETIWYSFKLSTVTVCTAKYCFETPFGLYGKIVLSLACQGRPNYVAALLLVATLNILAGPAASDMLFNCFTNPCINW